MMKALLAWYVLHYLQIAVDRRGIKGEREKKKERAKKRESKRMKLYM
jgi:hypothetical protein